MFARGDRIRIRVGRIAIRASPDTFDEDVHKRIFEAWHFRNKGRLEALVNGRVSAARSRTILTLTSESVHNENAGIGSSDSENASFDSVDV